MRIAFYCDRTDPCLDVAIAAAREHMDCDILHLTTKNGPKSDAQRIEMDIEGPFGLRRSTLSGSVGGDILFLGSDVLCNADVSDVFDQEFDIAIATDMRPGHESIKYNADVIFSRCPAFWDDLRELIKNIPFGNGEDWYPLEKAYTDLIDSGKYKILVLPGEEYNYIPANAWDRGGKLTHYRGNRKAWMPQRIEFQSGMNTSPEMMFAQLASNLIRGLPILKEREPHGEKALIVGGGPSLKDNLDRIKGGDVFALNAAHDYLIGYGITPDYQVILDARPENVQFVQHPSDAHYLIAGVCHPGVFDALKGKVTLWVPDMDGLEHMNCLRVGGGATVGLKTMYLAYLMGYRTMEFFGFDSSYDNGHNHAYAQSLNDREDLIDVIAGGKTFQCAPWMAKQAAEFQGQAGKLVDLGCKLTIHGYGLIPWIMHMRNRHATDGQSSTLRPLRATSG